MSTVQNRPGLLEVERLELNLFRGVSEDYGGRSVFGGLVLGQALMAASHTVEGRAAHSLHAYFLRPGDMAAPIIYEVERSRDGSSFTTRRVVAIQHGRPIFNTTVSFQVAEAGAEHQDEMPRVQGPEGLPDELERWRQERQRQSHGARARRVLERPLDVRVVPTESGAEGESPAPIFRVWVRAPQRLPDDPILHRGMLAYASDYSLLRAAMQPHGYEFLDPALHVASLDHAMWFHRDFRFDEWLLYAIDSPSASGARGLCRGQFFTQDGRLVASTAQEGLLRKVAQA